MFRTTYQEEYLLFVLQFKTKCIYSHFKVTSTVNLSIMFVNIKLYMHTSKMKFESLQALGQLETH